MGSLLDFFTAGPARVKALLLGAMAAAMVILALMVYALWWRAEALQARGERDLARAQISVLADGLGRCNAGADRVKAIGDQVTADVAAMLAKAQHLAAPKRGTIERIETIIERPVPVRADGTAAGCDEAWDAIEADRKAGASR